jgi:hypothetical protein
MHDKIQKLISSSICCICMNSNKKDYTPFYKYQPIDDYLLENLKHNQLYFNDPDKYNDPFDSKIYGYEKYTEEEWVKGCMEAHTGISKERAEDALKYNIEEGILYREGNLVISKKNLAPLACCFSLEPDNILMWSHYANHHKGICICFKANHRPLTEGFKHTTKYGLTVNSLNIPLFEVKYNKDKPRSVDILEMSRNHDIEPFLDFLLTKSPCWGYEKEYRLIAEDINNIRKFKKEELEGIIFGLRIRYFDAYTVYKTIEKNYLNKGIPVNFYKAQEKKTEIGVEIIKIENINEHMESLSHSI